MVNQLPMSKLGMSNQAYGLLLIFPPLLPATYLASPSGVTHTVRPSILRYTTRNLLTVPLTKVYCFLILPCMPPVGCLGFVFPVSSQFYHSALVLFLLWQSGALLFLSKGNLRRPALCFFFVCLFGVPCGYIPQFFPALRIRKDLALAASTQHFHFPAVSIKSRFEGLYDLALKISMEENSLSIYMINYFRQRLVPKRHPKRMTNDPSSERIFITIPTVTVCHSNASCSSFTSNQTFYLVDVKPSISVLQQISCVDSPLNWLQLNELQRICSVLFPSPIGNVPEQLVSLCFSL